MRVLLTGATGKIGNAVARRLVDRGDHVVALVRDPARGRALLPPAIELAPGDVTDPESLRLAAAGSEAVMGCMGIPEGWARDADAFNRVNAGGARAVARAAREAGATRLVHTSTFDVFHAPRGGTVGGGGLEVVMVNPAGIVGPGPWAGGGFDSTLRDLLRGRLPLVPPGGMSLTYVGDAADAHLAALDRGRPGERYIVAGG